MSKDKAHITLDTEIMKKARDHAKKDSRTLSSFINKVLKEFFDKK